MARDEQEREDLLREATALVERIEIHSLDHADSIVIGFRNNGAASIYFGSDPAYHFNSAGELRRAFVAGLLYKSVDRRLVSMRRERSKSAVELHSHELTDVEQSQMTDAINGRLASLQHVLVGQTYEVVCQIPSDVDLVSRVVETLGKLTNVSVALSPHVQ